MKTCLWLLAAALSVFAAPNPVGVIKSVKGEVMLASKDSAAVPATGASLCLQGARIETGADGKAMLRLLPDNAFVDVRPQSAFTLKRIKAHVSGPVSAPNEAPAKDQRVRRLVLEKAEVIVGLKKKSDPVQCENAQTLATAAAGRFSCRSDEKGTASFLVQDGELTIYNRPKDITATVRAGQKAVSDLDGIRVSDATDADLDEIGFSQNTLEVDFVNPQTEDFTTLEVEYESNF
jgi:hypothetical protein